MKSLKMAGIVGTVLKSNITRLNRPYKLNFCVTYWCQSRCAHCSIWKIRPKGELTLDEIKEFAKQNRYFQWLELTGGEPFLRQDIVEIARTFKESCSGLYLLTMPTNSLCNYEMEIKKIEEIAKLGIPNVVITVSLDGYRELEDKIRGVPGNYDKAIRMYKGITELSRRYPNLIATLGFTIINANAGQLQRTVEEVMKEVPGIHYTNFHVNVGQVSDNYYGNTANAIAAPADLATKDVEFLLEKMKTVKEHGLAQRAKQFLEVKYMEGTLEFLRTRRSPIPNRDGELSVFMDSYGTVFPSIMTSRKLGSIRQDGSSLEKMLAHAELGVQHENYYTPCESYQSVLGALLKMNFGSKEKSTEKAPKAVMEDVNAPK